jgi:hypothetical protein
MLMLRYMPIEVPDPNLYIHFTTEADAQDIVESGVLHVSAMIVDTVYAVEVGGVDCPGVQYGGCNNDPTEGRKAAVLFTCDIEPNLRFCNETCWDRNTPLPIIDAMVIPVEDAVAALDGSLGLPEMGCWREPTKGPGWWFDPELEYA